LGGRRNLCNLIRGKETEKILNVNFKKNFKKRGNNMSIIIKIKKELTFGGKLCKIISIDALKENELPRRYTKALGAVYLSTYNNGDKWLLVKDSSGESLLTKKGSFISPKKMEEVLNTCKKAGMLLRKVYLEIENEGWEGEETFVI